MFNALKPILGIDIGNVITDVLARDRKKRLETSINHLLVPEKFGAFQAMNQLHHRFEGQVCLVSQCKGSVQVDTRHWLMHHKFFEMTGVDPNHVFFCERREGKAPICEALGVTHFIDDRLEVLGYLQSVQCRFLFNPDEREVERHKQHLPHVKKVHTWQEFLELSV